MGLHYPVQNSAYIIGTAAADVTLTGAYAGNLKTVSTVGMSRLTLYVSYTAAEASRTFSLLVEGSPDGQTYFPVASIRDVSPWDGSVDTKDFVDTITSTGASLIKRRFSYDIADEWIRVSVKEDGSNFGTANVRITLSGK